MNICLNKKKKKSNEDGVWFNYNYCWNLEKIISPTLSNSKKIAKGFTGKKN